MKVDNLDQNKLLAIQTLSKKGNYFRGRYYTFAGSLFSGRRYFWNLLTLAEFHRYNKKGHNF